MSATPQKKQDHRGHRDHRHDSTEDNPAARELAATLLNAAAVRRRCRLLFEAGRHDALTHFSLHLDKLEHTADFVLDTMRAAYPTLAIPYHSRWRHFGVGGVDRWAKLAPRTAADAREQLRVQFELAITSVLLDAGAGPHWRYREAGGGEYARSEGLAVASFHLFASGAFSSASHTPLRADADSLAAFSEDKLADAFQAGADNPLEGLAGRAALIRRLGEAVRTSGRFWRTTPAPGRPRRPFHNTVQRGRTAGNADSGDPAGRPRPDLARAHRAGRHLAWRCVAAPPGAHR